MSPYQMIYDRIPVVDFLHVIGSIAYVHKHKPTRAHVLDTQANKGILLCYARYTKGSNFNLSVTSHHHGDNACYIRRIFKKFSQYAFEFT